MRTESKWAVIGIFSGALLLAAFLGTAYSGEEKRNVASSDASSCERGKVTDDRAAECSRHQAGAHMPFMGVGQIFATARQR